MIPDSKDIYARLDTRSIYYLLSYSSDFFQTAEEYVKLQKKFIPETIFEKVNLWFELYVYPIIVVIQALWKQSIDIFLGFSLQKIYTIWNDYIRFINLQHEFSKWVQIVRNIGGPFIATNNPEYHIFVYADAMQRIKNCLGLQRKH